MHAVERTIQNLIGSGLDPQLENNPYLCFVYTSFQVDHLGLRCSRAGFKQRGFKTEHAIEAITGWLCF